MHKREMLQSGRIEGVLGFLERCGSADNAIYACLGSPSFGPDLEGKDLRYVRLHRAKEVDVIVEGSRRDGSYRHIAVMGTRAICGNIEEAADALRSGQRRMLGRRDRSETSDEAFLAFSRAFRERVLAGGADSLVRVEGRDCGARRINPSLFRVVVRYRDTWNSSTAVDRVAPACLATFESA